jgi:hypothetical protein
VPSALLRATQPSVRPVLTPRSQIGTMPAPSEAPQRAEFYPMSPSHYTFVSLLHWTAHPPAIGPVPSLASLIPYWSAQSTGLLYNQRSFRARLTIKIWS